MPDGCDGGDCRQGRRGPGSTPRGPMDARGEATALGLILGLAILKADALVLTRTRAALVEALRRLDEEVAEAPGDAADG